jgi:hypothetical protein
MKEETTMWEVVRDGDQLVASKHRTLKAARAEARKLSDNPYTGFSVRGKYSRLAGPEAAEADADLERGR